MPSIPTTTRALLLMEKQKFEFGTIPLKGQLDADEVLCAVYATGICGSDIR